MLIGLFVAAYFLGSIPVGFLVAKAKGIDILKTGSGNIGATNVWRALGPWLGALVFSLDVVKGFLPALAGFYLLNHSQVYAFAVGIGAVVGHCLSPFLRFKGGKGVATGLGVLFGSSPLVALSAFGVFVATLLITRYVSLSSIVASVSLIPFCFVYLVHPLLTWACVGLCIFVIYRHRPNIVRLLNGSEPKFSFRSSRRTKAVEEQAVVEGLDRDGSTSAAKAHLTP